MPWRLGYPSLRTFCGDMAKRRTPHFIICSYGIIWHAVFHSCQDAYTAVLLTKEMTSNRTSAIVSKRPIPVLTQLARRRDQEALLNAKSDRKKAREDATLFEGRQRGSVAVMRVNMKMECWNANDTRFAWLFSV